MNFLPAFAGAVQGQQDYADAIQRRAGNAQTMDFNALRMQQFRREMEMQAADQKRQEDIARGTIGLYAQPQQPAPQPPMPGQSSQPMRSPGQAWQPMDTSMAPQGPIPPRGQGAPAGMPPQGPQGAPQGPQPGGQGAPQGPAPLPPYRSMAQAAAPQAPSGIPEPPKYDWGTAVKKVQSQGITDPQAILATLEKYQSRLDLDAQRRLVQLKEQVAEDDRRSRLDETARHNREMEGIGKERADKARNWSGRGGASGGAAGAGMVPGPGGKGSLPAGIEAATWDFLIKNAQPPKRGNTYQQVMGNVEKIAKDNGLSVQELMSASADVKTKLAAKRSFEIRAQNTNRAENVLNREIPNFEQAVEKVNTGSIPAFAKLELAARRQMGDPEVTRMDQAADVIFREFEGIVTGNPGTLNVQDVQNAHEAYRNAQTPQQAKAAVAGMRRIIDNAKKGLDDTRTEIMDDINRSLGRKVPTRPGSVGAAAHPADIDAILKKYGG